VLELALQQYERIGSHMGVKQRAVPVVSFAAVEHQPRRRRRAGRNRRGNSASTSRRSEAASIRTRFGNRRHGLRPNDSQVSKTGLSAGGARARISGEPGPDSAPSTLSVHRCTAEGRSRPVAVLTLYEEVKEHFGDGGLRPQSDDIHWPGGYFGFPGSEKAAKDLDDEIRQEWRKEYLPGPTALAALSLCTAIAGLLLADHPPDRRLRITLHRTRMVGEEPLLQQCCEYVGACIPPIPPGKPAAARTFPVENATIGLSYRCREVIRSAKGVPLEALRTAMAALDLNAASRVMSNTVGFIMAMPIVQPEAAGEYSGPSPVVGVLYIDSEAPGYFIHDSRVKDLAAMVERFVQDTSSFGLVEFRRIRNRSARKRWNSVPARYSVPTSMAEVLEMVSSVQPPRTTKAFQLNFDYVDFVPA
jgi:hypothetical protein